MPFTYDTELGAAVAKLFAGAPPPQALEVGDVAGRRARAEGTFSLLEPKKEVSEAVKVQDFHAQPTHGDTSQKILLQWVSKTRQKADEATDSKGTPALLYIHGGGMIAGTSNTFIKSLKILVDETNVPVLSVDYRLAPEEVHPVQVEDCYVGLKYLVEHAAELGVDVNRIGVMGASAGGGLAASVAILARERHGPAIARQILIYPMLDDRTVETDSLIAPHAIWSYDDNRTGWGAMLGGKKGWEGRPSDNEISKGKDGAIAAAARVANVEGLPPLSMFIGELDIFRDECVKYAQRFWAAGISTDLHVLAGLPHAYDWLGSEVAATRNTVALRNAAIARL